MTQVEQRRVSDPLILEMHSNLNHILEEMKRYNNWLEKHEKSNEENFKSINDDITSAKATMRALAWMGGAFIAIAQLFPAFFTWFKNK